MKPVLIIAAIGLVLFVAFRGLFGGGTESWHQRLTLVIETPLGEVRGSAVTGVEVVEYSGGLVLPEARGPRATVTGEAVAVEVLPGRWLFALLDGSEHKYGSAKGWVYAAYPHAEQKTGSVRMHDLVMGAVRSQPYDMPVELPRDSWPMLVTFDDITGPETVREVDPDDLDASFGCARSDSQVRFPWREMSLTYRDWVEAEVIRLSRERAAIVAGLPREAAAALVETYSIIDDHSYDEADERRLAVLRTQFTEDHWYQWEEARKHLRVEIPSELPTPQSLAEPVGGPCFRLDLVTLEITREAVTKGRVEGVVGWINDLSQYETIPGNPFSNSLPSEIGHLRTGI